MGCPSEKTLFAGRGKSEAESEYVTGARHRRDSCRAACEGRTYQFDLLLFGKTCAHRGARESGWRSAGWGDAHGREAGSFWRGRRQLDEALDPSLEKPGLEVRDIHLFTGT